MIKNFRLTIDILADIPDQITPEFVEKIVAEVDKENRLPHYHPQTAKHQELIDYIKNNENIHEECLTGDIFFNLTEHGFDDELTERLNPKWFDDIVLEKTAALDNETRIFISQRYKDVETNEKDAKIDEEGNPLPNSKKDLTEALKREIDTEIIQQSVLNYKITAASFKRIEHVSLAI